MTIDEQLCARCGRCVAVCPEQLIAPGPTATEELAAYCLACGHCATACPAGAIRVEGVETTPAGEAISSATLMELLRYRRSGRLYTDEPVSRAHLEALLAAAATAPSAKNFRPVKAYVVTDAATIARIHAAALEFYRALAGLMRLPGARLLYRLLGFPAALREKLLYDARFLAQDTTGDPLLHHARTLLAFTAPRGWGQGIGDAWLAAHSAVLYAETIPLATCYNGFIAQAAEMNGAVRRAMGVPRAERVAAVLTLGYPATRPQRGIARAELETVWK